MLVTNVPFAKYNRSFKCSFLHNPVSSVVTNLAGDWSVGATPVPIPNTVVKPYSADGTPLERARESRPSPAPFELPLHSRGSSFFHSHPLKLRSGFVAVVGRPNVGKSTLLNRLVGQKLAITSPRPQSTRDRVTGILTFDDTQIVLVDTPGLLEPTIALQHVMRATALQALRDADVILHLIDATERDPKSLVELAGLNAPPRAPVLVARTKADLLSLAERENLGLRPSSAECLVSAVSGERIDELRSRLSALLPEGPFLYPDDDISTQHLRFFAAELIRETTLEQLDDEVPHAIACTVEEFREDRSPVYIRAIVYVERDSQKRIVIGHAGARIREIGRAARLKIESLLSEAVYLDLWVKVLLNWRRDQDALRRLGYILPEVPRS